MFSRLRTKLTVLYAGLFGVTLVITALAVFLAISANAERVVRGELQASGTVFDRLWTMRASELQDAAELLSRDFGFREAVASHDQPTIQSALENLRQRSGIDLALVVGVDGRIAASDGHPLAADLSGLVRAIEAEEEPAGVTLIAGKPYEAIATPILSPTLTGWVVFAQRLDGHEMNALEQLSAIPLTALVVSRTSAGGWNSDQTRLDKSEASATTAFVNLALAGSHEARQLDAGQGPSIAVAKPLKSFSGSPVAVLLLEYPLARALAPYRLLLEIMIVIALAGIALAIGGSWVLAAGVTRPVSALDEAARRLRRGESARVVAETGDEIGRLAQSFNQMAEAIAERERQITHLAIHDGETDLPNRLALERSLAALETADGVMVAALTLDRFSQVREVIGYELAGVLIRQVAARLTAQAPEAVVGRLSSNTLGVIFQAADPSAARTAAVGLLAALEEPMQVGDATTDVSITIGLAPARGDPEGLARSPLVCASIAAGQAHAARQKVAIFDPEAYGDPANNLSLMSDMLRAIDEGRIEVFLQPKHDIRGGRISAAEALVRWRHQTRGLISPDLFIPLAEETGHIRPLTDCVLRQAIEHQRILRSAGHDVEVSVNISGRLLSDPEFADAAVEMAAGAVGRLCFEVTETAVIDQPERALAHIERFADAGVSVSIDDYGSGLSSLAYLRQIRAEELKVDKAFILSLADSRTDALLVRSTIDLAHSLGLKVTAEGVETHEVYALLATMGCDFAQGFLIERPMPLEDFLSFLADDGGQVRRYG
jgi:EAL domain-containing protein (putative c-di-GMP-specific phosphodiesterase class I)/GGDEF domain-containing protein